MDMDEFGMGSPTEAFVLSGNCEVLGLDTCSGKFIRRISSSCCSNIISAFADARMLMRGLNPRVANSPSFSILIILNPTQFQGSERWSIREMLEDGVYSGVFFPSFSLGLPA
ncbi:hypothetical protein YC2023_119440 [Brassica napus]